MVDERYFYGTCFPVYKSNCSGDYIDPCDCRKYYLCDSSQYRLISQECGQSLAFDGRICDFNTTVLFSKKCNFTVPWQRCNASAEREQWLQGLCTNTSNTLIPTSTTQADTEKTQASKNEDTNTSNTLIPTSTTQADTEKTQASKNEDYTGLIVGLVIALIIIVIITVAFGVFWMYRRRKQRERGGKSTQPQMERQQYFAETDDDYQQIDDSMIARGGNVLYENCVGPHGSTSCRLVVLSPVPSGNQTEPVEETTRNHDPGCRVFLTQLPVHDPADTPLWLMNRENHGFTVDVSHSGSTMSSASSSYIHVIHTQDQITLSTPSCMSLEHCGSTSANSLVQSVNKQLGEIARSDSSYLSVRGNDST